MKKLKVNQRVVRNGTKSEYWKVQEKIAPLWPPVEMYLMEPDPVVKGGDLPVVVTSKNWTKYFQEIPSKSGDTASDPSND